MLLRQFWKFSAQTAERFKKSFCVNENILPRNIPLAIWKAVSTNLRNIFRQRSEIASLKVQKKHKITFLLKQKFLLKLLLWTPISQFCQNCRKFFAKSPKTFLSQSENIYWNVVLLLKKDFLKEFHWTRILQFCQRCPNFVAKDQQFFRSKSKKYGLTILKKNHSKWSSRYVGSSYDKSAELLLFKSPETFWINSQKNNERAVGLKKYLKRFLGTRKWQFWQPCRGLLAWSREKNWSKSDNNHNSTVFF